MIKARIVNESDCADLLLWRNDSQSRKNFFSSDYLKEEDHVSWFKKILASKYSKIIILEFNDQKIGMVRYDTKDFETYVSINTNPLMRGKGHSSEMLLASEKLVIDDENIANNLNANILKSNHISIKVFEKAGYQLKSVTNDYYEYIKKIK